ncbi:MAG: TlpA family protein disulfide reductase [Cyclobacteriaceae bacterium]
MRLALLLLTATLLTINTYAQDVPSYSFADLQQKMEEESEKQIVVVNFWATWCKPCIKELPYFEALNNDFPQDELKVLLVSLDMEKEKAVRYRDKKQLESEVVYLDETDFNQWIDRISPSWSGAIPATLLLAPGGNREFHEGVLTQKELYTLVNQFIEKNSKL